MEDLKKNNEKLFFESTYFKELNFFVISDTHFFHNNIIKYANRPLDSQNMLIKNWNNLVAKNDLVLHMGDLAFGQKHHIAWLGPSLPGRKFLIKGNHDNRSLSFYEECGFKVINPFSIIYEDVTFEFTHRPIEKIKDKEKKINIHGHTHNRDVAGNYYNVSCEKMDYRPFKIKTVLENALLTHPSILNLK